MLVSRADSLPSIAGGILAAITLIGTYSLATRLLPDRLGVYDPIATYRLSQPMGYWNALGLFVVMGVLIALGLVAHGGNAWISCAAAAVIPVLVLTNYFTFSRGAWLALSVGLVVAVALDRHPAALLTVAFVLAAPSALLVLLASRSEALTSQRHSFVQTVHDGHRLLLWLFALVAVSAALGLAVRPIRGFAVPRAARISLAGVAAALVVALVVGVAIRPGEPRSLLQRANTSFNKSVSDTNGNLTQRLLSFSSNGRKPAWVIALQMARAHPLNGDGAGTFEMAWNRDRHDDFKIVDAHSVYLETLGELGAVGLGLLLVVFLAPLAFVFRARRAGPAAALAGAYVAFLVHGLVDWDWEVPAVTLAGVFCGLAILAAARRPDSVLDVPGSLVLALVTPLAALAVFAQLGWSALSAGQDDITAGRWQQAEEQASKARRWQPWSADPWVVTGEARLGAGDPPGARLAFRRAIAEQPGDWHNWYELALVARGAERRRAIARAKELNPLSQEVAGLESAGPLAP